MKRLLQLLQRMAGKQEKPHCTRLKSWSALKQMQSITAASTNDEGGN
ncbi:hypothetical protein OBA47_01225 [bacterium]|nr:hypothetical protein [bacterium]